MGAVGAQSGCLAFGPGGADLPRMPSSIDLSALEAAWFRSGDRPAEPPPELARLVDALRDEAGRAARAAPSGSARAGAIATQMYLAVAAQRLHGRRFGFAGWQTLAALAHASEGEARSELAGLALQAGGGAGRVEPRCLAELAPLLAPAAVRASALARLDDEGLDHDDQGVLLGLLPEEDIAALLPPRLERAAAIEDARERWSALASLVDAVPERWRRRAVEVSRARNGIDVEEAHCLPEEDLDEAVEARRIAEERARWGAPFTAWRLGERASRLPEPERGPILDRAIEEFEAIALTPVSPGNDEGPFWAFARLLDEPRVRRALAVVDHMESVDWKGDLCASRASLIARLALLGHADEAERMIPRIGTTDTLAAHHRAAAWGGVLGARLRRDPSARFERLFDRTAGDPDHGDPAFRLQILTAATAVFESHDPAPDAANVEAMISLARSFEPRLRTIALETLLQGMLRSLPVQRWLELILADCKGEHLREGLLGLATASSDAGLDPTQALRPLLAHLDEHGCADAWTLRDLLGLRAWIPPDDGIRLWTDFLLGSTAPGISAAVDDVRADFPEILLWLAGAEALLPVGRALARASARFT